MTLAGLTVDNLLVYIKNSGRVKSMEYNKEWNITPQQVKDEVWQIKAEKRAIKEEERKMLIGLSK